jgi:hypothetical protein
MVPGSYPPLREEGITQVKRSVIPRANVASVATRQRPSYTKFTNTLNTPRMGEGRVEEGIAPSTDAA